MKLVLAFLLAALSPCLARSLPTEAEQVKTLVKVEKQWIKKLKITTPIKFDVVPERQILTMFFASGGHPTGFVYGSSFLEQENEKDPVLLWVMRLQDYPAYASRSKIIKDQRNTVVHELIHIKLHTHGEEAAVDGLAGLLAK